MPLRCHRVLGDRDRRAGAARGHRGSAHDVGGGHRRRGRRGGPRRTPRLRSVGTWLGIGVANLVNVFNPDVVVFGGTLREILPATRDTVQAELSGALRAPQEHVLLSLPALGDDSTLLGAAETAFAPLLDDPLGVIATARADSAGRLARVVG